MKLGKIAIVALITALIWVWADLAQDDTDKIPPVTISFSRGGDPTLSASFNQEPTAVVKDVEVSGPSAKIDGLKRGLEDGSINSEIRLEPAAQQMTEPGRYILDVRDFLRKSDQIGGRGLTVRSCDPETLSVLIERLVRKSVTVVCLDENQTPVTEAVIEPPKVEMLVPADYGREALVLLNPREREQARLAPVEKTPHVSLGLGRVMEAAEPVKVRMPPEPTMLKNYTITTATLGFTLSANLLGRYSVKVENLDAVVSAISIVATSEAKRAYESMPYQVVLEIDDSDAESAGPLRREVKYNFPTEYIDKGQVRLNQQPVIARFALTKLSSASQ
jgi:hypothetical protein